MDNIYAILGITAGVLSLVGYIPYIISILRGKTLPNKASWIIWSVVGGLIAFSYLAEGDKNTIWLPLGYFLGPLITALISLRYGYSVWSRLDKICLVAAMISIIPWLLFKDGTYTLIINVLIDSTGAIPTLVKTYREPDTEDISAWSIFLIANTIQVLAISDWNLTATYPVYLFLLATAMVVLIMKNKLNLFRRGIYCVIRLKTYW